jgi:uncharacterized protein
MTTHRVVLAGPEIEVVSRYEAGTVPAFAGKYLSVTAFRDDFTPVATPVWFVKENGRLLFETDAGSGKIRRIRANPLVQIAECTARCRLRGEQVFGWAEILTDRSRRHVEKLIARKYRGDMLFIRPFRALQKAFGRRKEIGPVIVAVTPAGVH